MASTQITLKSSLKKKSFKALSVLLRAYANRYDENSVILKKEILTQLLKSKITVSVQLTDLFHSLLFLSAHPSDKTELNLCSKLMEKIAMVLKQSKLTAKKNLENTGLPFTTGITTYSHDFLNWFVLNSNIKVSIDSFYKSQIPLTDSLLHTLPALEKEYISMATDDHELLNLLRVTEKNKLNFILSEFSKLNHSGSLKDYLFNGLHLYVTTQPINRLFSKPFNQLRVTDYFFHHEILKQFHVREQLDKVLPSPKILNGSEFQRTTEVIKFSLALLQRETDPVTYMDESSFRFFELERGISIAIYGMIPDRQLPLESYVGYSLFKNGFPAAYGGAWVFGKRALFGINIFESFRGGESAYMMCQLLRVYRQCFGIDYFEVEPYQYGLDNPEGISSGAYWFYYRFGFRSLDKELKQLAEKEFIKIKSDKSYRSSEKTLNRFTESNIALQLGEGVPVTISTIREKSTVYITNMDKGNRKLAEDFLFEKYRQFISEEKINSKVARQGIIDLALMYEVLKLNTPEKLELIESLLLSKTNDIFLYQTLLLKLFS